MGSVRGRAPRRGVVHQIHPQRKARRHGQGQTGQAHAPVTRTHATKAQQQPRPRHQGQAGHGREHHHGDRAIKRSTTQGRDHQRGVEQAARHERPQGADDERRCQPPARMEGPHPRPDRSGGVVEPRGLSGLPQQQQPQCDRSDVEQRPRRSQGGGLRGEPAQPLHRGSRHSAEDAVTQDAPPLEQPHGRRAARARRLPQPSTSCATHGDAVRPTRQSHQGRRAHQCSLHRPESEVVNPPGAPERAG